MISIIICSINPEDLSRVSKNISATIGSEYELLVWDNGIPNLGLCEVYNKMAGQAAFDIILFLHEDVLFKTQNWGIKIAAIFNEHQQIGAIGLAGSKYKSKNFSGWYTGVQEFDCANIVHRYSYGDEIQKLFPAKPVPLEEVVCIDGVFICCRKSAWQDVKFDEENLKGFHFYDIDFSLRMAKILRVAVTYEIDLVHITKGGDFGEKWVKIAIDYHQLKKAELPFTNLPDVPNQAEKRICKTWLDVLKKYKITGKTKWQWIMKQQLFNKPFLYYSILKFLIYGPLGLKRIHKQIKSK